MVAWKNYFLEHFAPQFLILLVVLVLVLNSALVMGIQIAVDFPLQSPDAAFSEQDNWEILDSYRTDRGCGYILWQDHRQWRLVVTERHFHANRWRTVCDTILMEQDFEEEFPTSYGRIMVKLYGYADFDHFNWIGSSVFRVLRVPADFLMWNAALLAFEIIGIFLIRKLRRG